MAMTSCASEPACCFEGSLTLTLRIESFSRSAGSDVRSWRLWVNMQRIAMVSLLSAACAVQARPVEGSVAAAPVRVTRAQVRPEERWLAGNVSAARHAQISTRAAATVREVRVREGDRVKAGTVLVRLADGDLRAQAAAGQAALDAARANERRVRGL